MKKMFLILIILIISVNAMGFKATRYKCPCRKWGIQCSWKSKTYYKYCPDCKKSGHKAKLKPF
jgi:hypothetical protein